MGSITRLGRVCGQCQEPLGALLVCTVCLSIERQEQFKAPWLRGGKGAA